MLVSRCWPGSCVMTKQVRLVSSSHQSRNACCTALMPLFVHGRARLVHDQQWKRVWSHFAPRHKGRQLRAAPLATREDASVTGPHEKNAADAPCRRTSRSCKCPLCQTGAEATWSSTPPSAAQRHSIAYVCTPREPDQVEIDAQASDSVVLVLKARLHRRQIALCRRHVPTQPFDAGRMWARLTGQTSVRLFALFHRLLCHFAQLLSACVHFILLLGAVGIVVSFFVRLSAPTCLFCNVLTSYDSGARPRDGRCCPGAVFASSAAQRCPALVFVCRVEAFRSASCATSTDFLSAIVCVF